MTDKVIEIENEFKHIVHNIELPKWASWLAQDADGSWWAYENEPNQYDKGWYENELGRRQAIMKGSENSNWKLALYPMTGD